MSAFRSGFFQVLRVSCRLSLQIISDIFECIIWNPTAIEINVIHVDRITWRWRFSPLILKVCPLAFIRVGSIVVIFVINVSELILDYFCAIRHGDCGFAFLKISETAPSSAVHQALDRFATLGFCKRWVSHYCFDGSPPFTFSHRLWLCGRAWIWKGGFVRITAFCLWFALLFIERRRLHLICLRACFAYLVDDLWFYWWFEVVCVTYSIPVWSFTAVFVQKR